MCRQTFSKCPLEYINLIIEKKKSKQDRFRCYVPNERPQRNQELLGLTAERPGDDRGGYKQLREETGGFSSYFTSNLLEQKNLVGCTAQPCTDKAVRRKGFERQLSRRLMVLCTHNFEGLRESYGPIPSVLKLDCVKDRHPGYSRQVKCVWQVLNSCTHAHTRTDTDFLQQNTGWLLLQTILHRQLCVSSSPWAKQWSPSACIFLRSSSFIQTPAGGFFLFIHSE